MTEDQSNPAARSEDDSASSNDDDAETARTAEEVEALWRNRVSKKDAAHAAEQKALRDQLAAAKTREDELLVQVQKSGASSPDADVWKQKYEEAQRQADAAEQRAQVFALKTKYPNAVEVIGEDMLTNFDEARLAGIEARMASEGSSPPKPPTLMDANTPPRTSTPTPAEPTVASLKADLARMAPEFLAEMRDR